MKFNRESITITKDFHPRKNITTQTVIIPAKGVTSFSGAKNSCFVSCHGDRILDPIICYLRCVFLTEHQQQQDLIVMQSHEETDSKTLLKKTSSW
jgi:hypothetical protein